MPTPANIYLALNPAHIDFLNKILEGYEYLGVLSTLDRQQGLAVVRGTTETYHDLLQVLNHLPFTVSIITDQIV